MTVFSTLALDRHASRWEDQLDTPTPVEEREGWLVKREDQFAPLGDGGVNGAKVRQLCWLVSRGHTGREGLVYAGSVKSPQVARVATVAAHYGLACDLVIGSELKTAVRHESVAISARMGASFHRAPAPYNPSLQAKADQLMQRLPGRYRVGYGMTFDGSDEEVEAFYHMAGEQAATIPSDVDGVLIAGGSCNTLLALLYRLAGTRNAVERVVAVGVGPNRLEWLQGRLVRLGVAGAFRRHYPEHPELELNHNLDSYSGGPSRVLEYHDLFALGLTSWDKEARGVAIGGLPLHPLYEAKVWRFARERRLQVGRRPLFWIVGGEQRLAPMERHLLRGGS